MYSIKFHRYWLVVILSIILGSIGSAQDCTLSFVGKDTLCSSEIINYEALLGSSITDIEWTLEGNAIGDDKELSINWENYGDGLFDLCVQGTSPCNGSFPRACKQIKVLPTVVLPDSVFVLCTGNFISVFNPLTNWRDTAFSTNDIHTWTYVSATECRDVTYDLTILPTDTNELGDTSICQGAYLYVGIDSFNTNGRHCGRVVDEEGCIIFDCYVLEVKDSIQTIINDTICNEEIPYAVEDTVVVSNSNFLRVYTAADGCDSTVFVNIIIRDAIASSRKDTVCVEEVLEIGDTTFSISGIHQFVFESVTGCDSTVTIDLLVRRKNEVSDRIEMCQNEQLPIDQDIVTLETVPLTNTPGTVFVKGVAIDQNGCDSTINYTIIVNPTSFIRIDTTLCYGTSINIGGNIIRSASSATIPLKNQFDCDSIISYTVRITPDQPMFEFKQVVCPGVDLYVGDSLLTETGYYEIFVPTEQDCDSLVIADIIVKTEADVTKMIDGVLCAGEVYREIQDTIITTGGTHILKHLKTTTDCDSIIILTLQVLSGEESETVSESICAGDFFVHPDFPFDTMRTQNTFFWSKRNPETCIDFDLAITINFLDSVHVNLNEILCEGDSIGIGNKFYKEEGVFMDTLQRTGELGCDSIITLTIQLRDCNIEIEENIDTASCNGATTGSIDFFVTEGKPPLIYEFKSASSDTVLSDTITVLGETIAFDSLAAGSYSLTLRDTVNGYKDFNLVVPEPAVLMHTWEVDSINGFQLICNGDKNGFLEILVTGGTMPYSYLWDTGDTTAGMTDLSSDIYAVTVTDANDCQLVESFTLEEPMPLISELDIIKPNCEDLAAGNISIKTINGGVGPYKYKLKEDSEFAAKDRFSFLEAGDYHLMIQDANGCIDTNLINLPIPQIPELQFNNEIAIDLGEAIEIDLESNVPLYNVVWEGPAGLSCYDCQAPIAQPLETQVYTITGLSVDSCVVTDQLTIFVDKKRDVFVPNIFSPNGDGINDYLVIYGGPEVSSIRSFQVFSRWGGLVYENQHLSPNEEAGTWDGTVGGKRVRPGVFIWKATISFIDGVEQEYFGDVVIK